MDNNQQKLLTFGLVLYYNSTIIRTIITRKNIVNSAKLKKEFQPKV